MPQETSVPASTDNSVKTTEKSTETKPHSTAAPKQTAKKFDPDACSPAAFDTSGYPETVRKMIKEYHEIIKSHPNEEQKSAIIPKATKDEALLFREYLDIYYGEFYIGQKLVYVITDEKWVEENGNESLLIVYPQKASTYEQRRRENISAVKAILRTFNDGNDEYILKQISNYIKNNVKYNASKSSLYDILHNKRGSCMNISFLFQMLAMQAGIRCDFATGYASVNGEYHAWNIVYTSNGKRWYDTTLYRSSGNTKWLGAKACWHAGEQVNRFCEYF